jgi:hypothetical protein
MRKSTITFLLLLSVSFSIVHGFVFYEYDTEHTNLKEYIQEIQTQSEHNDICDTHSQYHQLFLFATSDFYLDISRDKELVFTHNNPHILEDKFYFFRPPIS